MVAVSADFVAFDETPPRTGLLLALVPAAAAVAAAGSAPLGLVAALPGAFVLVAGVRFGSRRFVSVGTVILFAGMLVAGVRGVPVVQVTIGAAATVVAWDAGTNAVGVARQLGTTATTQRVLLVHTVVTTLVAGAVAAGAYAVFWITRGGEPTTAVALLVLATLVFVWLLDR